MGEEETKQKPETRRYLTASEYFLNRRDFTGAKTYALRARESDPFLSTPNQIISIATVLSTPEVKPNQKDYYTILNLSRFESDRSRIESRFKTLASILNPNTNPYPLSSEAFDLVVDAWSILSNPIRKANFDDLLSIGVSSGAGVDAGAFGTETGTFWTMCPYCYYAYEFNNAYEECCLRCTNKNCNRGFQAVKFPSPPPEVVEKGQYVCPGFVPYSYGNENLGLMWLPFSPSGTDVSKDDGKTGVSKDDVNNDGKNGASKDDENDGNYKDYLIEISDDENKEKDNGNVEKPLEVNKEFGNGELKKNGGVRRKKSVPWNSKKVMGRGVRVGRVQGLSNHGVDDKDDLGMDQNESPVFEGEIMNGAGRVQGLSNHGVDDKDDLVMDQTECPVFEGGIMDGIESEEEFMKSDDEEFNMGNGNT